MAAASRFTRAKFSSWYSTIATTFFNGWSVRFSTLPVHVIERASPLQLNARSASCLAREVGPGVVPAMGVEGSTAGGIGGSLRSDADRPYSFEADVGVEGDASAPAEWDGDEWPLAIVTRTAISAAAAPQATTTAMSRRLLHTWSRSRAGRRTHDSVATLNLHELASPAGQGSERGTTLRNQASVVQRKIA